MIRKKLMKSAILIGPVLAALLGAGIVLGCASDTGIAGSRDSGNGAAATQEISEAERRRGRSARQRGSQRRQPGAQHGGRGERRGGG